MRLPAALRLIRPHQWTKNLLVFGAPAAAHAAIEAWIWAAVAFVAMCGVASFVYVLNDWRDREDDRNHPRKSRRPIASGAIGPVGAVATGGLALSIGLAAASLSPWLIVAIAGYIAVSLAYVLWLKRRPICDLAVLTALYEIRLVAGAVAAGIPLSPWMIAFTSFFFLGLAALKRVAEIAQNARQGRDVAHRGYVREDEGFMTMLAIASLIASVVVLAIYIGDANVALLYERPAWLWGIVVMVLVWTLRVSFLAQRGAMHDDPVVFALKDRWSQVFVIVALVFALGAVGAERLSALVRVALA